MAIRGSKYSYDDVQPSILIKEDKMGNKVKKCTKCKRVKLIQEFYLMGNKYGTRLESQCKVCSQKKVKAFKQAQKPQEIKPMTIKYERSETEVSIPEYAAFAFNCFSSKGTQHKVVPCYNFHIIDHLEAKYRNAPNIKVYPACILALRR